MMPGRFSFLLLSILLLWTLLKCHLCLTIVRLSLLSLSCLLAEFVLLKVGLVFLWNFWPWSSSDSTWLSHFLSLLWVWKRTAWFLSTQTCYVSVQGLLEVIKRSHDSILALSLHEIDVCLVNVFQDSFLVTVSSTSPQSSWSESESWLVSCWSWWSCACCSLLGSWRHVLVNTEVLWKWNLPFLEQPWQKRFCVSTWRWVTYSARRTAACWWLFFPLIAWCLSWCFFIDCEAGCVKAVLDGGGCDHVPGQFQIWQCIKQCDLEILNSSAIIFLCFVGCLSTSWIISILRFRDRPLWHTSESAMLIWPLKSDTLPRPSSISPPTTVTEPLIPCQSTALFWQSQSLATNYIRLQFCCLRITTTAAIAVYLESTHV